MRAALMVQLGLGALAFCCRCFVKDSMIPMVVIMTTTTFSSFFDFTDWEKE
jgi:hypothetical protein